MKTITWERFNQDEDDTQEEAMSGMILSTTNFGSTNNSYEDFNMFIAHCDFRITFKDINNICDLDGIESFDALSPYRFRISVGKLFETKKILDNIESVLTKG